MKYLIIRCPILKPLRGSPWFEPQRNYEIFRKAITVVSVKKMISDCRNVISPFYKVIFPTGLHFLFARSGGDEKGVALVANSDHDIS